MRAKRFRCVEEQRRGSEKGKTGEEKKIEGQNGRKAFVNEQRKRVEEREENGKKQKDMSGTGRNSL